MQENQGVIEISQNLYTKETTEETGQVLTKVSKKGEQKQEDEKLVTFRKRVISVKVEQKRCNYCKQEFFGEKRQVFCKAACQQAAWRTKNGARRNAQARARYQARKRNRSA